VREPSIGRRANTEQKGERTMSRIMKWSFRSGMVVAYAVMAMAAGMWLGNVAYAADDCCRLLGAGPICSVSEQSCPGCPYVCSGQMIVAIHGYTASIASSAGYDDCCSSKKFCAAVYDCKDTTAACPGSSQKICTYDAASRTETTATGMEFIGSGTCP
jgi:hypothetical protein